jgi:hypothetical protein
MYHKIEDFSLLNPDEAHHHHHQQQQQQRLTLIPGSGRDGQGGLGDATARKRTAGQEEEDNARKKARAPEGRAAGADVPVSPRFLFSPTIYRYNIE